MSNMKKQVIEKACNAAGLKAVRRENVYGYSVCIADGFAAQPHLTFRRFGAEQGDFPFGCFCTIFWIEGRDDEFEVGVPMLFDAFHDPSLPKDTKQLARINTAINAAADFLKRRERISKNGLN